MKKDPNRPESPKPDYTLPRSKILRGRKNFRRLFEKSTVLNSSSLQFRFRVYEDPREGCLIGFAAPRKIISKAVRRNRAKRRLREVYRTQQSHLSDLFDKQSFGFHGLFVITRKDPAYADIKNEMGPLLIETRKRLIRYLNSAQPPRKNAENKESK